MQRAKYKTLDDGTFYGWVDELPGVWANKNTLEDCRDELEAVIDDWLLLGLRLGHAIPPLRRDRFEPRRCKSGLNAWPSSPGFVEYTGTKIKSFWIRWTL